MPEGWNNGPDFVFNFAHAIGAWSSRLPSAYSEQCEMLAQQLLRMKPAQGWLPKASDDPVVIEAFRAMDFQLLPLNPGKSETSDGK
jgi:hypothetical protein